jgi:hypothetical protein
VFYFCASVSRLLAGVGSKRRVNSGRAGSKPTSFRQVYNQLKRPLVDFSDGYLTNKIAHLTVQTMPGILSLIRLGIIDTAGAADASKMLP